MFLEELVEEHATIAGDVVEIDTHTWAIHGSIAVDGDVIMAEYDSEEHARIVLDELSDEEHGRTDPDRAAAASCPPGWLRLRGDGPVRGRRRPRGARR